MASSAGAGPQVLSEATYSLTGAGAASHVRCFASAAKAPVKRLFAVVQVAGKQYKVTSGDVIATHRLEADLGSKLKLEKAGQTFIVMA